MMCAHRNKPAEQLRRHSDSILTLFFARSLSKYISIRLSKTNITPLQVTLASLLTGLFAAYLGSKPYYSLCILAAILLEISHVLDCVDGELARLTKKGNPFAASMDPITDRVKDSAVLIAAYVQGANLPPFEMDCRAIAIIALVTLGMWLIYMYVVDAFLNPSRSQQPSGMQQRKIYLGLYDLFIYGSIAFWLSNCFNLYLFFIAFLSALGIICQIVRLRKILIL